MSKLNQLTFIILTIILSVYFCKSEQCKIFTAVGPKTIHPNSYYNVSIGLSPDRCNPSDPSTTNTNSTLSPEVSKFQLVVKCLNATFRKTMLIPEGTTATVPILIDEIPANSTECDLSVTAENYKETEKIFVIRKERNILLIQTDKPIYKPGETIRFRVIPLTKRFQTPSDPQFVDLTIFDPLDNIIKIWRNASIERGLFSSNLLLTSEPNLGDWKIVAKQGDNLKTDRIITVAQYVLPKFKVELKLQPPFVIIDSSDFVAEVRVFYTHGAPVNGFCSVELSPISPGYKKEWVNGEWRRTKISGVKRVMDLKNGVARLEFNIFKDIDVSALKSFGGNIQDYNLFVTGTEAATGIAFNASSSIKMYEHAYKISKIYNSEASNKGLSYSFKITTHDDIPVHDSNPEAVNITLKTWESGVVVTSFSSLPSTGIISIEVNNSISSIEITYKKVFYSTYIQSQSNRPHYERPKSQLSVQLTTKNPKVEELIKLHVHSEEPLTSFSYMFLSTGDILEFQSFDQLPNVSDFGFQTIIPKEKAAPVITLIVYCVSRQGEILADSIQFNFASVPLSNYLSVSLPEKQVQPGANVTIQFRTKSNSTIALKAIDQSVLLLKNENDVNEALLSFKFSQLGPHYHLRYSHTPDYHHFGSHQYRHFKDSGLVVLTNGILPKNRTPVTEVLRIQPPRPMSEFPLAAPPPLRSPYPQPISASSFNSNPPQQKTPPPIRIRKHFPETWLWEEILGDENTTTTITRTVPDTLTSWVISGFSLSPDSGIGLNLIPQTLKTFRPFFLSLNLPYSIVKGEIFGLQVLVHNYLPDSEDNETTVASVTLDNKENQFQFLENEYKGGKMATKQVVMKSGEVSSVTFVIVPNAFGIMKLGLKAVVSTGLAGDGVERSIIVKPPGRKEIRNQAVLLNLKDEGQVEKLTLQAEFPESRVLGADSIKISVVGDIMGATASNLDYLIQMPTGCGEQNMLKFVPDIVILDYLSVLGDLKPEIKSKAVKFLESGYQRQLTYRHSNGSFSAFGKSDKFGSTWLTAFVIKSFAAAGKYITIDELVILQGVKFLLSKQNKEEGSFQEEGRVLNMDLQGGTFGSSLTSYVVLSLIEVSKVYPNLLNQNNSEITTAINLGLDSILSSDKRGRTPYSLNLAAYAFQLAEHPENDKYFKALERTAKIESNGFKYWEKTDEGRSESGKTKSVSVEMTSYALMTYLQRGRLGDSVAIGKWLLKQRNPTGGFISTQDTVVGLTALAQFALATKSLNSNLKIKAKYDGVTQNLEVNQENLRILQEVVLPEGSKGIVEFEGEGVGAALLQLSWSYYIEEEANSTFELNVEVLESKNEGILPLKICTTYARTIPSNMAVMEIRLPSGYTFSPEVVAKELATYERVKRHELEDSDTKLNIYFDKFKPYITCIEVSGTRDFVVANLVKSSVIVYDYYDNTLQAIAFYEPPQASKCDVCNNELSCRMDDCKN